MPGCAGRLAYLGVTNTLALLRRLPMSDRGKDAEILALRHQIVVLERQLHGEKVRFTPPDRASFAALLHRLPRDVLRRARLLVRPETVLCWHCHRPYRGHRQRPTAASATRTDHQSRHAMHPPTRWPRRPPPRIRSCCLTCADRIFCIHSASTLPCMRPTALPGPTGASQVLKPGQVAIMSRYDLGDGDRQIRKAGEGS
jgi:hypothetical protein